MVHDWRGLIIVWVHGYVCCGSGLLLFVMHGLYKQQE